jgi:hypothetical protein
VGSSEPAHLLRAPYILLEQWNAAVEIASVADVVQKMAEAHPNLEKGIPQVFLR